MKRSGRRSTQGPSAIELIEESVHLLRRTPPETLFVYYAGTVPFALAAVFYWAQVTWFRPSDFIVAWNALGLVTLFALMKAFHANFCARLLAHRLGAEKPVWSRREWTRVAAAQFGLQAWALVALPTALVVVVPFGWTYAYFQSASVLSDEKHLAAIAGEQARLWPGQNHLGQLLLSAALLAVWVNVAVAFWMVPWLANRLLGMQNLFGFTGWWIANSTFIVSTAVLSWLALDPLIKTFFTLRVFYGRARRTGEDLRVELRNAQRIRPALQRLASVILVTGAFLALAPKSNAAESGNRVQSIEPARLNDAIDQVLGGNDFRWRLRPVPAADTRDADESWIKRSLRAVVETIEGLAHGLSGLWRALREWMRQILPARSATATMADAAGGVTVLEVVLWCFVVFVAGLLIGVGVLAWRRARLTKRPVLSAQPVTRETPDLHDDATQAAQLPTEGWLVLAREQLGRREWRLAWRALYLATLAQLAAEGLVSLARFKTNLDYEREVRRRAISRQEVVARFSRRRGAFEAVWYGRAQPEELSAREWLAELERPSAP